MKKVLVTEDEASIREFIVINLERAGYTVLQAADGSEARRVFAEIGDIDVVVLDIMMPQVNGLDVCKTMRAFSFDVGIILLTAKTQEMDKVTGLMMGADDYVTKPFSPSELIARVDVLYRRVFHGRALSQPDRDTRTCGGFTLHLRNRTLLHDGASIELTQVEFQIMEYFFENPGAALSRTDILRRVWGAEDYGDEKIVDVNIRRLRMKVEKDPSDPQHLFTVWGVGYKWVG